MRLLVMTSCLAIGLVCGSARDANSSPITTISFESHPGPSVFTGATAPLKIGIATFVGGQTLTAQDLLPADQSTVYGTAFPTLCPGCTPFISINFSRPIKEFSILVLNGDPFPVTFFVTDDTGGGASGMLDSNLESGSMVFSLPSEDISQVLITSDAGALWDFSIDNVRFIPEPSAFLLLASGLVGGLVRQCARRCRRAQLQ